MPQVTRIVDGRSTAVPGDFAAGWVDRDEWCLASGQRVVKEKG